MLVGGISHAILLSTLLEDLLYNTNDAPPHNFQDPWFRVMFWSETSQEHNSVNSEFGNLNPEPCTLNYKLWTLNGKPKPRSPNSYILNPKPKTTRWNPKTLNPLKLYNPRALGTNHALKSTFLEFYGPNLWNLYPLRHPPNFPNSSNPPISPSSTNSANSPNSLNSEFPIHPHGDSHKSHKTLISHVLHGKARHNL